MNSSLPFRSVARHSQPGAADSLICTKTTLFCRRCRHRPRSVALLPRPSCHRRAACAKLQKPPAAKLLPQCRRHFNRCAAAAKLSPCCRRRHRAAAKCCSRRAVTKLPSPPLLPPPSRCCTATMPPLPQPPPCSCHHSAAKLSPSRRPSPPTPLCRNCPCRPRPLCCCPHLLFAGWLPC